MCFCLEEVNRERSLLLTWSLFFLEGELQHLIGSEVGVVGVWRKANTSWKKWRNDLKKMKMNKEASKEDEAKTTQVCTTQIEQLDSLFVTLRILKSLIYPILSPNPFFIMVQRPTDWFLPFPHSQYNLPPLSNCYAAIHELILFISVQYTSPGPFCFHCLVCHISSFKRQHSFLCSRCESWVLRNS